MNWVRRNWWRAAIAALVLFLTGSIAAPFLSADRFGAQIRAALEAELGRPVETGKARFHLFTGAGFSISEVIIAEDPQFGLEPFAWVETLEAYPEFWSLFTGKLRFSEIRMSSPVVNLVKVETSEGGRWNLERLLARKGIGRLPKIEVQGGRVNFKFGIAKSVFYLTNADFALLAPRGERDGWRLDFTGEPARTDRVIVGGAGNGMGTFRGAGVWRGGKLKLDLTLERSPLGDLVALASGRDLGFHGVVTATLGAAGPLDALAFEGRVRFEQMHRWDQMPLWDFGIPVKFRGKLNVPAQRVELASESEAKDALPLAVRFAASNYLARPDWRVEVEWARVPAAGLLPAARHLGLPIPERVGVEGMLAGTVGYASATGLAGRCRFQEATLQLPDSPPVRVADAEVVLDGNKARLQPATATIASGDQVDGTMRVEGSWGWRDGSVELAMAVNGVRLGALKLEELTLPRPSPIADGVWFGALRYRRAGTEPGDWNGSVSVRGARVPVDGLSEPLRISIADLRLQGARWSAEAIRAEAGGLTLRGSVRSEGPLRPLRFQIEVPEASGSALESLFLPTLMRGDFLRRTFGFGRAAAPVWLASRKASGVVKIGVLRLGPVTLEDVRTPVVWTGTAVRLTEIGARVAEGAISAEAGVDLAAMDPRYQVRFAADSVEWNGASYTADGTLTTSGTGRGLLANLRSEGTFAGRAIESSAILGMGTVNGCFRAEFQSRAPQLRFTELQATVGAESYIGRGGTQPDGKLALSLTSGNRQLRLTGSLPLLRAEP